MNAKTIFTVLFASLFAFAVISSVSALSFNPSTVSLSFNEGSNKSVALSGVVGTPSVSSVQSPAGAVLSASISSSTLNVVVQSVTGTFNFGSTASGSVNVSDNTGNYTLPVTLRKTFCSNGAVGGNLEITQVDVSSDGDDDEVWAPLDKVTIDVNVENIGNDNIDEIVVEMALYDSDGKNKVGDLDFTNADEEEIDFGDLNDGDDDTVTFEFQVPADFDEGNYKLAIKAYSDDLGQNKECVDFADDMSDDFYQDIEFEAESDEGKFIAFTDVEFSPTEATCGDQVTLAFNAYNIGDEDQDRVKINVYSKDLKIDQSEELVRGLDTGDHQEMLFTFNVPQSGLTAKTYNVELSADYDYKERDGLYREQSDEADKYSLRVVGCSASGSNNGNSGSTGAAKIVASLDSEATAGEQLLVTATVTNRLSTQASFVVDASGYNSWAKLDEISPRIVTLDAGESKDVSLTFTVDDDASGEQSFTVETTSGSSVDSEEFAVNLAQSNGAFGFLSGNSGLIWGIAIVNVVLLVVIVLVAIRVARN